MGGAARPAQHRNAAAAARCADRRGARPRPSPESGPSRRPVAAAGRQPATPSDTIANMDSYEFRQPPILLVGIGVHSEIPGAVAGLGRRPLVVTDRNCAGIAEVAATIAALAGRVERHAVFVDVPGEPTTDEVAAGQRALHAIDGDVVVGIGGGSVMDTAKAVAAMAASPGTIVDYVGRDRLTAPRRPLVLAPTTAGTGSEATRYTVITDPTTNVKHLITDWRLLPDVAICDPLLTVGSPPPVTAAAGVDALTHAIEAYVSRRHQPTADLYALGAIRQLYPFLERAWRDGRDLEARTQTTIGALHAGIAFCNSSVALVHGMSRPIGAYFHVAHGLSNAMLLPTIAAWSIASAPERYRAIADTLGLRSAAEIPDLLADLSRRLDIPRLGTVVDGARLRALAPQMARDAIASGSPANNPRVPTEAEIVDLYADCL